MIRPPANSVRQAQRHAFTMIELIAVIVVIGILGGALLGGLGTGTVGFVHGRNAMESTQKAQMAMQRMILELRFVATDEADGSLDLTVSDDVVRTTFRSKRDEAEHVLEKVGSEVHLDGHTLVDQVNTFSIVYSESTGKLTITLDVGDIGALSTSLYP